MDKTVRRKFRDKRGFASMDPEKQRMIASLGGKAAHEKGTAHEWTVKTAAEAGRIGGSAKRNYCISCKTKIPYYKIKFCSDKCQRKITKKRG